MIKIQDQKADVKIGKLIAKRYLNFRDWAYVYEIIFYKRLCFYTFSHFRNYSFNAAMTSLRKGLPPRPIKASLDTPCRSKGFTISAAISGT
jgi:hypothetical protein